MKTKKFNNSAIKKIRRRNQWSVRDVVYEFYEQGVKISSNTYRKWENGDSVPAGNNIYILHLISKEPMEFFYA